MLNESFEVEELFFVELSLVWGRKQRNCFLPTSETVLYVSAAL